MKTYFYLTKQDPITVYFKYKDRTGYTFTSHLPDAMRFNSRNEAIDYSHKWLHGDCEVVEYSHNHNDSSVGVVADYLNGILL